MLIETMATSMEFQITPGRKSTDHKLWIEWKIIVTMYKTRRLLRQFSVYPWNILA